MEVFVDGQVLHLDDYKTLALHGGRSKTDNLRIADKGHLEELRRFSETIRTGGDWPIPLWQQSQAMEIAFSVEEQITL